MGGRERSIDDLERRLVEADFFLEKMEEAGSNVFEVWCYFDAFVAAARSVTWVLQAVMHNVEGFQVWYGERIQHMTADPTARLFVRLRNSIEKEGQLAISNGVFDPQGSRQYLDNSSTVRGSNATAIEQSRSYLSLLVNLVAEAYREFPAATDPHYALSSDFLLRTGQAVEALEEALGYPHGWTRVGRVSDDDRLELLRRTVPSTGIEHLFNRYGATVGSMAEGE